jgi:hypothetical protein
MCFPSIELKTPRKNKEESQSGQPIMLRAHRTGLSRSNALEALGSNLGWVAGYPERVFSWFSSSLQVDAMTAPRLGHDRFLSTSWAIIIQPDATCSRHRKIVMWWTQLMSVTCQQQQWASPLIFTQVPFMPSRTLVRTRVPSHPLPSPHISWAWLASNSSEPPLSSSPKSHLCRL